MGYRIQVEIPGVFEKSKKAESSLKDRNCKDWGRKETGMEKAGWLHFKGLGELLPGFFVLGGAQGKISLTVI
jgi:hypothetical protein